jgi:hypothetical protein
MALVFSLPLAACAPQSRLPDGFDLDAFQRSPTALGGVANRLESSEAGAGSPEQINALIGGHVPQKAP